MEPLLEASKTRGCTSVGRALTTVAYSVTPRSVRSRARVSMRAAFFTPLGRKKLSSWKTKMSMSRSWCSAAISSATSSSGRSR
ncbi:MAG: hypothetical protein ACOZQL_27275 [Myxococcota bacterium]